MKFPSILAAALVTVSPANAARYIDIAITTHTSAYVPVDDPDSDPENPPPWEDVDFYGSISIHFDILNPDAWSSTSSVECEDGSFDLSGTSVSYSSFGCPLEISAGAEFAPLDFSIRQFTYDVNYTSSFASEDYLYSHYNLIGTAYGEVTSLIITGSSDAVPELASWAMMLMGFGAVGGAMRNRRKVAVSFG